MVVPILLAAGVVGLLYATRTKGPPAAVELKDWYVFFGPESLLDKATTKTQEDLERKLGSVAVGPGVVNMGTLPGHAVPLAKPNDPLVFKSTSAVGGYEIGPFKAKILWLSPDKLSAVVELPAAITSLIAADAPTIVKAKRLPANSS